MCLNTYTHVFYSCKHASKLHCLWYDCIFAYVAGIGLYYGYRDRHAKDTETFLLGGRRLPLVPVVLSLFVGWMTSISFIGDPVEVLIPLTVAINLRFN